MLFRLSLFEGWTFVGDSDRLNTVLNVRLFETDQLRTRGSISTWVEEQFMGSSLLGLHWMLPIFTPIPYLLALLPSSAMYPALAWFAALLLAVTMAAAYVAVRPYSHSPIPAFCGALVYGLSSYALHKLTQLDLPFCIWAIMPLTIAVIRATRRETVARSFLGLAICWAALVLLTFLQEVAYVTVFIGAYALYRTVRLRDPWPLGIVMLSFVAGVAVGLPRIITVGQDFQEFARSQNNYQSPAIEALRFFGDGLLGRYMGEQHDLLGGTINMHEGVQFLGSALAAMMALAVGVLARSWWLRLVGVAILVVLAVPLVTYQRPFYDIQLGLAKIPFITRETRATLANLVAIGVPLGLLSWWLVRRIDSRPSPQPSLTNTGPLPRVRGKGSYSPRPLGEGLGVREADDTPVAVLDTPFFVLTVLAGLAVLLLPEARTILYYAFFKVDFTHSRFGIAALLPLAALTTIFLNRFVPERLSPSVIRWLMVGGALGVALWLGREALANGVVERFGPILFVRPARLVMVEVVRVLTSLALFLVALAFLVSRAPGSWLTSVGGMLVVWLSLETVLMADFKLNGPQTTQQARPFESNNKLNAPAGALRPPTSAERAVVRDRLEAEQYRTLLFQDRAQFTALVEPHIASFWNLRLVEGYSTGLPRRIGLMPWVDSMVAPHTLDIHSIHSLDKLPWHLLAALNVKYAVVVDQSLWYNPAPGGPVPPLDVNQLQIVENPYPVTPRAFFAARVTPAGDAPLLAGDDGKRPPPTDPPIEEPAVHSVVEGIADEQTFSTAGTLSATFDGDRIQVRVDPSSEPRFLVLNELYHPRWYAWIDGQPTRIYPTNLVMRGIVVPPGATTVELRFEPFMTTLPGVALLVFGLVLVTAGWWGLRRLVR